MIQRKTIRDAAAEWSEQWDAIPREMIIESMKWRASRWREITLPIEDDEIQLFPQPDSKFSAKDIEELWGMKGEIIDSSRSDAGLYSVVLENGAFLDVERRDFRICFDYDIPLVPTWRYMWSFSSGYDNTWLSGDGLKIMSELGFRVFEHEEWGYFFGLDYTGSGFLDDFFVPLYKARGLHRHTVEE